VLFHFGEDSRNDSEMVSVTGLVWSSSLCRLVLTIALVTVTTRNSGSSKCKHLVVDHFVATVVDVNLQRLSFGSDSIPGGVLST
jgi:hypothetical protein